MPDPIDELENFDPGAPMTPLPPSEVRRLGDRHRRRRTAGIALAAAAAVAIVATGSAVLAGGEPRALDPATPNPTVTSPTVTPSPSGPLEPDSPGTEPPVPAPDTDDIPDGFPLAAGWPERHEPGPGNGLTGPAPDVELVEVLQVCDAALPAAPALDRLGAVWTNVEDYRNRQLLTFEDAEGAIAYQRSLVDAYRACPRSEDGEGNAALHDVRQTRVGGESWAVVRTFEFQGSPAIGMEVVHVIRLGRALLVDTASTEGGGGPDPDAQALAQVDRQSEASAQVVSAMCTFTEAGC